MSARVHARTRAGVRRCCVRSGVQPLLALVQWRQPRHPHAAALAACLPSARLLLRHLLGNCSTPILRSFHPLSFHATRKLLIFNISHRPFSVLTVASEMKRGHRPSVAPTLPTLALLLLTLGSSVSSAWAVKWTLLVYILADNDLHCYGVTDLQGEHAPHLLKCQQARHP